MSSKLEPAGFPLPIPTEPTQSHNEVEKMQPKNHSHHMDKTNGLGGFKSFANMTAVGCLLVLFAYKIYSDEQNRVADRVERQNVATSNQKLIEKMTDKHERASTAQWSQLREMNEKFQLLNRSVNDAVNELREQNGKPKRTMDQLPDGV